jgi:hypothetical protein
VVKVLMVALLHRKIAVLEAVAVRDQGLGRNYLPILPVVGQGAMVLPMQSLEQLLNMAVADQVD